MSSEKNLKKRTPKLKCEIPDFKDKLARVPIAKHREEKTDEDSEETESKNLYPDISELETENESYTYKVTRVRTIIDKETIKISTISSGLPFSSYFAILFAICVLLLGGIITYFNYFSGNRKIIDGKTEVSVADLIKDMENRFKNQHELTYLILKSQLKKVVDKAVEPSAPAIITLIANEGAEGTASEFSQHLVRKLAPETHLLINDTKYWDDEPDSIILKIDEEIRTFAQDDHLNIIVIDKVEKIPARAAMIFHSYCDHEAAPYKRAIFLFIVPANKVISMKAKVTDIDRIAMDRLRDIWHEASNDLIDSLITRLTVSVVSVR